MIRRFCILLFCLLFLPPAASALEPASGRLLVAADTMADVRFRETVILLLRHDRRGSLGLVLNRPSRLPLAEAVPNADVFRNQKGLLWLGGPVAPGSALVLTSSDRLAGKPVLSGVWVSGLRELIQALGQGEDVGRFRVYAGYAGWAPGQLAGEIARGDWQVQPATVELVFGDAAGLWRQLSHKAVPVLALRQPSWSGGPAAHP